MRPRKLSNQNGAVSNQLVEDGRGWGSVGDDSESADVWREICTL
jgi:hypothetical protein